MPTVPLQVSNVSRAIQAYVEQYSGGVGFPVKIVIVNSEHLSEDYDELSYNFSIMESSYDSMWVTFHLGTPSPLRMRFPQDMFIADHCNWRYGTAAAGFVECAISAATLAQYPSCQRTLAACRLRQNSARYGGFKGLSAMGYRIAR
jgi:phage-related protein